MRLLVTGGCGFIGSNFIRYILKNYPSYEIINIDALTYAGNRENLYDVEDFPRYRFIHGRIEDVETVKEVVKDADAVVHFAAESHVDRSIVDAQPFLKTNIIGTHVLLDAARNAGIKRFIHISTDEVYGTFQTDEGEFTEEDPLKPNSPYAASKASADLLVRSYIITYEVPAIIIRPSNNYGPFQLPEKFIPLMVTNLIDGLKVPVYGKGLNIRDWLFVEDTCRAIDMVLHKGKIGEIYNVGGGNEKRNIEVVRTVLSLMQKDEKEIEFVPDRPGHDYRYSVNYSKISRQLGWAPQVDFNRGIEITVRWYRENQWWWRPLKERLKKESKGFWTDK
jgi:dTDP-glucose 4,6-dehydratase